MARRKKPTRGRKPTRRKSSKKKVKRRSKKKPKRVVRRPPARKKKVVKKKVVKKKVAKKIRTVGCKGDVWYGRAKHTSGGLKRSDLKQNKYGKIVSKKKSSIAKRSSNLGRWLFESGQFTPTKYRDRGLKPKKVSPDKRPPLPQIPEKKKSST